MSAQWARVAETVKRRRADLGLSQRAAARLADDLSPTTWNNLERHHAPMSPLSAAAICKALGWTTDSIDLILAGGEPVEGEPVDPAPTVDAILESLNALQAEVRRLTRRVARLEAPPD